MLKYHYPFPVEGTAIHQEGFSLTEEFNPTFENIKIIIFLEGCRLCVLKPSALFPRSVHLFLLPPTELWNGRDSMNTGKVRDCLETYVK